MATGEPCFGKGATAIGSWREATEGFRYYTTIILLAPPKIRTRRTATLCSGGQRGARNRGFCTGWSQPAFGRGTTAIGICRRLKGSWYLFTSGCRDEAFRVESVVLR